MRVRTFFFERFLRSPPPGNKNKKNPAEFSKKILFLKKKEMFSNTQDFLLEPWRQRVEHPFKDSGLVQLC